LYYKDSGSVNKGHYVESNESVSITLSHDYTTKVVTHSQGLVDFAIGLVTSVLNLLVGVVKLSGGIQITEKLKSILLIKNCLWAS